MTRAHVMQAAVLETYGTPFRTGSLSRPEPEAGQVLVRIHASGINPLDTKIHQGEAPHARQSLPAVLGIDLAGVVEEVGVGVSGFCRGDEVYGMTGGVAGLQGSLATYAAVDADLLAPKPANLTMRGAAALPLIFITAWEGLVDRAAMEAGQTVLIHGGAGGVGHIAVQLAIALGATVFATGSSADQAYIAQLGATAIDYRTVPVSTYVKEHTVGRGFDLIYDTVGGATLDASFEAVRRFGHVVSCLGWGAHGLGPLSTRAATYSGVFTLLPLLSGEGRRHHGEILREATRLVEAGAIIPRVDPRHFGLDTVCDAYRLLKEGSATGKLVVDIAGPASSSRQP